MTDEQMREYIDHAIEKVLAPMLEKQSAAMMAQLRSNADDVVRQWERYPTREERLAEAEQRAWDEYAAAATEEREARRGTYEMVATHARQAAKYADDMLKERRKRFGDGKEADVVRVGRGVLERAVDAILEARAPGQYEDIVNACRAAMSE